MAQVRILQGNELKATISQEIGKERHDPLRKLKLCTYEKRKNEFWYRVIVDIQGEQFQLFDDETEENVRKYFYSCYDVIPCFWAPRSLSHLTNIFNVKVLSRLVELLQHGNTWSVAHICVSLPLSEDAMINLLTSDSFKAHFTSTRHPRGYTLLHLAIDHNSLLACKAIMRCFDQWLMVDPGLHVEDKDGLIPIQKAIVCKAMACLDYLMQLQPADPAAGVVAPSVVGGEMFQRAVTRDLQSIAVRNSPVAARKVYNNKGAGLHNARDLQTVIAIIEGGGDPECRNKLNDTPLHSMIKAHFSSPSVKVECVVALLAYGNCNPDAKTGDGKTALHLAVEVNDFHCASALLVFGASFVHQRDNRLLDIAEMNRSKDIVDLLSTSVVFDAEQAVMCQNPANWPPTFCRQSSCFDSLDCPSDVSIKRNAVIRTLASTYEKFKDIIETTTLDQMLATAMESFDFGVQQKPVERHRRIGDRVLSLDGGGIKGLILVELLSYIESITNKRIVDLFDWFIGTSTGGILALALVYTNLSLHEMRCLYFKLKDKVFDSIGGGIIPHSDTEALEQILKDTFGEHRKLGCRTFPRVLITAADAEYLPLKLVFFNNFEEGHLGKDMRIWEAARATSAAPWHFKQHGKYIDGGLMANNPSGSGLRRIHQYYFEAGKRNYRISCVVSLGCGMFNREMGPIDVRKALSNENFNVKNMLGAVQNLATSINNFRKMLIDQVANSDGEPVNDARVFCQTNKIHFYRLSPVLKEEVVLDEKNTKRLVEALILTKQYLLQETDKLCSIKKHTEPPTQ